MNQAKTGANNRRPSAGFPRRCQRRARLVTARTGLVVSSGTIDSLLTITTMALALVAFREWSMLSPYKIAGIVCTVSGIVLLHVEA